MTSTLSVNNRTRGIWLALLLLSPIAYLGGAWLFSRQEASIQTQLKIDRDQAIEITRQYALSKGVATANWEALCKIESQNQRYLYYRLRSALHDPSSRSFAPIVEIKVLLIAPARKEIFEARLNPDGGVIGYRREQVFDQTIVEIDEAKARTIAELAFRARSEAGLVPASTRPTLAEEQREGNTIKRYGWDWQLPNLAELRFKTTVSVLGDQVVAEQITSTFDDAFLERESLVRSSPMIVIVTLYIVLALAISIFGIFRFSARLRQKEVSFVRILLIAIAVAVTYGGFLFMTDVSVYDSSTNLRVATLSWLNRLFAFLTWVLIGVVLGFAYGSGEGDLRESYPGKLTSLDSILVGKLFSRNVAQALIHGTALSGWLFLLIQLTVFLFSWRPTWGSQLIGGDLFFAKFSWLLALLNWPASSLVTGVFTVLLPLPFLHRRLKNKRLIVPILFLLALIPASLGNIASLTPWQLAILPILFTTSTLLIAFFKFDLLTAIISLGASDLLAYTMIFLSQPAFQIRVSGAIIGGVTVLGLIGALYGYFRGRLFAEDEVRPLYASNLAERLSLQAEASAAREAQVRLLPDRLPTVRQLRLAAVCQPAHEVGGDFYDLYELGHGKLGIFMAEGGGRGLAAALTIAFAKGYLMPRILDETSGDNTPAEIVRRLKTQLIRTMAQDEGLGFIYAVVDTSDNTLRFAGTGDYPGPMINALPPADSERSGDEHDLNFALDGQAGFSIRQGIYYLQPDDTISLFTDGARRIVELAARNPRDPLWNLISGHRDLGPDAQVSLLSAMRESSRQAKDINDDLTAILVKVFPKTGEGEAL